MRFTAAAKTKTKIMQLKTNRKGFTLVEIMIVVAIIGLLASIAIPNFVKARNNSQTKACINNLRQIDAAKQQWGMEHNAVTADVPPDSDIQEYLGRGDKGQFPTCPAGNKAYTVNALGTDPTCANAGTLTEHVLTKTVAP
jgi:prepilin-type N-terminal cleavage/methylation domain-containing protein